MTSEDVQKLLIALREKRFLTEAVWEKALKLDKDGKSILYGNANGYEALDIKTN